MGTEVRKYYVFLIGVTLSFGVASAVFSASKVGDLFLNLFAGFVGTLFTVFFVDKLYRARRNAEYAGLRKQFHADLRRLLGRIEGFWRVTMFNNIPRDQLVKQESYFDDKYLALFADINLAGSAQESRGLDTWADFALDCVSEWKTLANALISRHSIWLDAGMMSDLLVIERCDLDRIAGMYHFLRVSPEWRDPANQILKASWPWRRREFFDAVLRLDQYLREDSRIKSDDHIIYGKVDQFLWRW